jgi:bifunctional non-homologous end joining protein LigD
VTWDEVESCQSPGDLFFTAGDFLSRVARDGDLLADLLTPA